MRFRYSKSLPLLALGLVSGCDRGPSVDEPLVMVSDSSGVILVENSDTSEQTSHLLSAPLLHLGSEDGDAQDFFGRIGAALLDPRGNLWVVDVTTAEVKVFSLPTGAPLFTVGSRGEGPGEFQMPVPIGFDDERAWIWDQSLGRLSVFSMDGEFIETRLVGGEGEVVPRLLHRLPNGTFLAQLPQLSMGAPADGTSFQDTVRVWGFTDDVQDAELVAERRGLTWYWAEGMQVAVPFSVGNRIGVGADRFALPDPEGLASIEVFESGRLSRKVRVDRKREPVTPDLLEAELDSAVRTDAARALLRAHAGRYPVPEFLPTWEWVRVGRTGGMFALRAGTLLRGEVWDVFDPEGRLLGALSLEDESHLMDADDTYLVVVEMPELRGPGIAVFGVPQELGT